MKDPIKLGPYQNTAMFRFKMNSIEMNGTMYYQMNVTLRDTTVLAVAISEEGELVLQESILEDFSLSKHQLWEFSLAQDDTADKKYSITSAANGMAVTVEGDTIHSRALRPHSNVDQVWRMASADDIQFPFLTTEEQEAITIPYDNFEGMHSILEEYGYCIVENVLDPDTLTSCVEAFGRDLLNMCDEEVVDPELSPVNTELHSKNGVEERSGTRVESPSALHHMLTTAPLRKVVECWPPVKGGHADTYLTRRGMSHGEAAWQIRTHPHVREVFSHLVPAEELCVGTDLMFFSPQNQPSASTVFHWGHVDINDYNHNIGSEYAPYQSFVALWEVPADDTTSATVIWPGSHKDESRVLIDSVGQTLPTTQHIPLYILENQEDQALAAQGARMQRRYFEGARRIPLPAGAMLVWSSRTIHQGWWGGRRLGALVCWEPTCRRPLQVLGRKARYAALGVPTTHQGSLGMAAVCFRTKGESEIGEKALDILREPKSMQTCTGPDAHFITFPFSKGCMRSYALRENITDEEVLKACAELEATGDLGISELCHLRSLMKSEVFNAL